ncbi:MAG: hypothetical protein MI742_09150 [Desulfobacterales bacterium]|nr:hypothetical protein [Desulfobacterales bacterium]
MAGWGKKCARWAAGLLTVVAFALILAGCEKEPKEREVVVGPWKDTVASYHNIITFRSNGSFGILTLMEKNLAQIDENAEKVKVEGKWQLLSPEEEGDPLLLVMTAESIRGESAWVVDTPVTYLVERLSSNQMKLRSPAGEHVVWDRIRGDQADEDEDGVPLTRIATGPLVVGLTKLRTNEENRYLCIQMELIVDGVDSAPYVEPVRGASGSPTGAFCIHPTVYEALILHLGRLRYKEVRSLKRFAVVLEDMERIVNPYLGGRLKEIDVIKVVVTTDRQDVDAFVAQYTSEAFEAETDDSKKS